MSYLGFGYDDIRIMTDDNDNPRDLPTKENIVSHPFEILLLPLDSYLVRSDEGIG